MPCQQKPHKCRQNNAKAVFFGVCVSVSPACWLVQPDEVSVTPEHPILGVSSLTPAGPWEASGECRRGAQGLAQGRVLRLCARCAEKWCHVHRNARFE